MDFLIKMDNQTIEKNRAPSQKRKARSGFKKHSVKVNELCYCVTSYRQLAVECNKLVLALWLLEKAFIIAISVLLGH